MTVGPVVRLWRRARRDRKMPDAELPGEGPRLVGSDQMRLDPEDRTVQLLEAGHEARPRGDRQGLRVRRGDRRAGPRRASTQALVAGAGDIVVGDPPPGADGWTIGIGPLDDPDAPPRAVPRVKNAAVSTSGDAERFVEIGGKRYSHIVDPRTGLGVVDRCSVTVVARDGATADSLRHGGLRPRPRPRDRPGRGHRGGRGVDRAFGRGPGADRPRRMPPDGSRTGLLSPRDRPGTSRRLRTELN